ncbi:hypothetical protein [Rhizobium sp.]
MFVEKLKELTNPYDFANPVIEERHFFGRSTETADVIYYLNHAKSTNRPIHIALVGARASGKTSFLNMAELEAKRRSFCCVRVNLNEADIATNLSFFGKIFNAVARAAFAAGAYGGAKGATHLSYLELLSTGEVSDIEQIPFISSFAMARAERNGNVNFSVPDDMIFEDLTNIHKELQRPVLILVDECNVLSKNRSVLEKLRNIFMNLNGFMLMFAATEDFFPVMDEIFSPIMRQFKRISIGPFRSSDDVGQCIRKPLSRLGLTERDVRNLAPTVFMSEVDTLSGRRPYEIQLICHELFKRCQEGKSKRFSLSLATLESIQQVLASGQNIDDRLILKSARRMKANLFTALEAACGGTENLSLEDTWRVEYLFHGEDRWMKGAYMAACEELQQMGFISVLANSVNFKGDQFDKVYLKYLARTKNIGVSLSELGIEGNIFANFAKIALRHDGLIPVGGGMTGNGAQDVSPIIELLRGEPLSKDIEFTPLLENILKTVMYQDAGRNVRLVEIRYKGDIGSGNAWFMWTEPEHAHGFRKVKKDIEQVRLRGLDAGIDIITNYWDIHVLEPYEICDRVKRIGDEKLATRVANELLDTVAMFYVERRDKKRALDMARAAFSLQESRLHANANNVGYLYMDLGEYDEARRWLQAAKQYGDEEELQLVTYNIATLSALKGDYSAALFELRQAKEMKEAAASCVYKMAKGSDQMIKIIEILDPPPLGSLIDEAIKAIEST